MSDAEATFYDIGHGITKTDASQMFGKKCFKVCKGDKPFVSFLKNVWYSSSSASTTRRPWR
jgi:hypothetical protein